MKISDVEKTLKSLENSGSKLAAVKLVNDIRGGGLVKSKEIVDTFFKLKGGSDFGKNVISYLKKNDDWNNIKVNIRKLK